MAARSLDLLVNVQGGTLLSSFNSTAQGNIPGFVFGDATPVSVRLVEPSGVAARPWREIDLTGQSVRIGIGVPGAAPTAGTFTLTYGGNTTSALAYNASAAQIAAALNALASITSAGGITVTATSNAFKVVFDDVGVRTALTADTGSLSPTSGAYISTVLEGSVSAAAIYLVKLEAMPASYVELEDAFAAITAITAITVREGATGVSDIQSITLDPVPYDGTYTLTIAAQETASLAYDSTAAEIQAALEALAAIGAGNVSVSGDFPAYTVTFAASLGNVAAITGNASALTVPAGRKGTLSNNTTGIAELLASRARVDATLEIELTDDVSGESWTPLQVQCTVREDVIPSDPASQTVMPTYLLESVANARYVRFDTAQSLTAAQRQQARDNDGATAQLRTTADIESGGKYVFLGADVFTSTISQSADITADTRIYNLSGSNLTLADASNTNSLVIKPGHFADFYMTDEGGGVFDFAVSYNAPPGRILRVDAAAALDATERRQAFENLGFTAYADLAAANAAETIGTLFFNIATATLAITTA